MPLPALVKPEFWRHHKLNRLAAKLGCPRIMAGGSLVALWGWCHEFRPTGSLEGLSDSEITFAAEWPNDPVAYVSALRECGWLDGHEVHEFQFHQGKKAIKNAQAAHRMANKRERERNGSVTKAKKSVTPYPLPLPLPVPSPLPVPKDSCSEPGNVPRSEPELPIPQELVGLALYECDERLKREWPKLYPALVTAHPGVNVAAEVRKAHAWEIGNPTRVKKRRARFLTGWMERSQDKGNGPVRGKVIVDQDEVLRKMEALINDDEKFKRATT